MIKTGIVATSSVLPKIEFEAGVEHLRANRFEVEVHPTVLDQDFLYTGSDAARASALIEYAERSDLEVIWFARGGYGATHLLPALNRWKKSLRGKRLKKKTLIGFSDLTALLEWFRENLGWETIHGPMPSLRTFPVLPAEEWDPLLNLIRASLRLEKPKGESFALTSLFLPKGFKGVSAPLTGGNLTVWSALVGTPDQGKARGRILFLEDLQENPGRLNRMVHQLEQSGGLKGCKAIVLGDFTDCNDSVPMGLARGPLPGEPKEAFLKAPPKDALRPLRQGIPADEGLARIFRELGERLNLAVFRGVPAGHGNHHHALWLGKRHELSKSGRLTFSRVAGR
jgi:muramoyltetrapeptide carboxypeptidase